MVSDTRARTWSGAMSRVSLPPAAEREDRRRVRARVLAASVLACFALLAGLWGWTLYQDHHPGPGPLGPTAEGSQSSSTSIPIGDGSGVGTFALITLANPTVNPAVIDEVRLVPPEGGEEVRLVDSWIARPVGGEVWAAFSGPPGQHYPDRVEATGAVIPPRSSGSYVLGLTLEPRTSSTDKASTLDGVDVRYRVGRRVYLDRWYDQVTLCPATTCRQWQ